MIQYSVTIPPRVAAGLRRLAATSAPAGCGAALIGTVAGDAVELRTLIPVPLARSGRHLVDPETLLRLQRQAASVGLQLVGFFRPGAGQTVRSPAALDRPYAGLLYIVVDAHDGTVRAWRIGDDRCGFMDLPIPLLAGAA